MDVALPGLEKKLEELQGGDPAEILGLVFETSVEAAQEVLTALHPGAAMEVDPPEHEDTDEPRHVSFGTMVHSLTGAPSVEVQLVYDDFGPEEGIAWNWEMSFSRFTPRAPADQYLHVAVDRGPVSILAHRVGDKYVQQVLDILRRVFDKL